MLVNEWHRWCCVVCSLLTVCFFCRRSRTVDNVLWNAHSHEEAQFNGLVAWRDCTGRARSGAELKRAYRQLAREAHPDRGGSSERFKALEGAQRQLQSPVQYNLRAAFLPPSTNIPNHTDHGVRDARLAITKSDNGPRARLEVDFTTPVSRGLWRFGLLARDVSAIEYSGSNGGYDMCCQFLKDSRCAYKPYDQLVAQHKAHEDQSWDAAYISHDCPLESGTTYTGVVDKPLHVSSDGMWAAVLELVDESGQEFACAAVTFRMMSDELQPIETQNSQL